MGLQMFGSTGGAPQYDIWVPYVPNSTSQIPTSQVNLNMQCVILASYLVGRASHPGVTMAKRANCIVCIACMVCIACIARIVCIVCTACIVRIVCIVCVVCVVSIVCI